MYSVYTIPDCRSCDKIIDYIQTNQIDCRVINYHDEKPNLPIFIFPALFYNDRLIAYGDDIITYFKNLKV